MRFIVPIVVLTGALLACAAETPVDVSPETGQPMAVTLPAGCNALCFADDYDLPPSKVYCTDERGYACGTPRCADGDPPVLDRCDAESRAHCSDGAPPKCVHIAFDARPAAPRP